MEGLDGEDWSAGLVAATVDRSLRRLGTDHLDVMLLHSCKQEVLERGEALGALLRAREAGKIRFAGYSGDNEAATFAVGLPGGGRARCARPACATRSTWTAPCKAAARAGTAVIAKRTVANAAWKPLEAQNGIYRDYVKPYVERFQAMGLDPRELGFDGPQAWMEIALRFTLAQPGVQVLSVGTTSPANAEANLRILEAGPLPAPAVARSGRRSGRPGPMPGRPGRGSPEQRLAAGGQQGQAG